MSSPDPWQNHIVFLPRVSGRWSLSLISGAGVSERQVDARKGRGRWGVGRLAALKEGRKEGSGRHSQDK